MEFLDMLEKARNKTQKKADVELTIDYSTGYVPNKVGFKIKKNSEQN
jgi:hypothetical protein